MNGDPTRMNQPVRWRDRGADAHALESRAALLVEAAASGSAGEPVIDRTALARIHASVMSQRRRERVTTAPRGALAVRLALAGLVLIASIASARGAVFLWRRYVAPALIAPSAPTAVSRWTAPIQRRAVTGPAAPPAAVEEAPLVPPEMVAPRIVHPPRTIASPERGAVPTSARAQSVSAGAAAARAPEAPPAPATPPPIVAPPAPAAGLTQPSPPVAAPPFAAKDTEAHLLAQALSLLRQKADPRAALATLDRYAQRFPHGVLEDEALRTRVEATMALPDPGAALALLDAEDSFRGAPGADLLIARAELRANAGRCADALGDFARALGGMPARDVQERALFGEAVCLLRLGRDERAQRDLAAYRQRFPRGRFSSDVERLQSGNFGARHQ